jgi:hypothetical protein
VKNIKQIVLVIISLVNVFFINNARGQDLQVSDGHVRETIPGTTISSAYFTIENTTEKSVTLVGASSNVSPRIEIHNHKMVNGMMSMQQQKLVIIPAHQSVVLQPSGLHLMIFDVKKPLQHGESIGLTLHFSAFPDVVVQLPVLGIKHKHHQH